MTVRSVAFLGVGAMIGAGIFALLGEAAAVAAAAVWLSFLALLATAGCTNATLFASGNLTASLAEIGQFPPFFRRGSRLGRHAGLLITAALVLVVANLVDLSAIAPVGNACSLMVFLLVGFAAYRLRGETGARGPIVLLAIASTAVVLGFFAVDTARNAPETFGAMAGMAVLAVALDLVWKWVRERGSAASPPVGAGAGS